MPLGGVMFSDRVCDVILDQPPEIKWMHAFTYSAHPTCCAVAHANLDVIEREGLVARADQMGQRLQARVQALAGEPYVTDVRGRGMMAGIELRPGAFNGGASAVIAELKVRGVFTRYRLNSICLAPPLVIKEAELEELCDIVVGTIRDLAKQG